jgi:NAD(P)-dependent dehydrogenase (short-subunit alcohol dehydrogenase family)
LQSHLAAAADARGGSRIVALSSTAHMRAPVDFDDIHFERRACDPQISYAQSKTANSLFAVEATKRWQADGIVANAVNPGGVATGLQRNFSATQRESLDAAEAAGIFTCAAVSAAHGGHRYRCHVSRSATEARIFSYGFSYADDRSCFAGR